MPERKKNCVPHAVFFFRNFKRPFTPRTRLGSMRNFGKTRFRRFAIFHLLTPNKKTLKNRVLGGLRSSWGRSWSFLGPWWPARIAQVSKTRLPARLLGPNLTAKVLLYVKRSSEDGPGSPPEGIPKSTGKPPYQRSLLDSMSHRFWDHFGKAGAL